MKTNDFSKIDNWVFERSSGYAGWRCVACGTWIYFNDPKKCCCDEIVEVLKKIHNPSLN